MTEDTATTVRSLLGAAGLTMSDEELELFVKMYPGPRSAADAMYLPEGPLRGARAELRRSLGQRMSEYR